MGRMIDLSARLVLALRRAYARKWSFLAVFIVTFAASVVLLGRLGLLPEAAATAAVAQADPAPAAPARMPAGPELPTRVEAPSIGLSATVSNPMTTAVDILDGALLHGAVRYPTSGRLNENGNVVLFGHSSYLPIVLNQAYKTFDGIQKLKAGDTVTVYSSDAAYTYRVRSMTKESANDAGIPLSVSGRVLTLSTCDSFGKKTDRFVVVADFVESHALAS